MDWIEFFCFIYVGQAFWYNFFTYLTSSKLSS